MIKSKSEVEFDSGCAVSRQIVANIDDEASGPSYSVTALSSALRDGGNDSEVYAVGARKSEPGIRIFKQDWSNFPVANRLMASGELKQSIKAMAEKGAVLHNHGLWLSPNIYPGVIARQFGVPLVISPRGMLGHEALMYSSTQKKVMWALAQRRVMRDATCFHATAKSEADDIRRAGMSAPIAIIPNGIELPQKTAASGARTILHLGRLHPKKGIDRLISAWAKVAANNQDWALRIVGPSEVGCREALEKQVAEMHVPRVTFDGPLYGNEKQQAYRDAGIFVLPTLNENFGMVVAEALASGVPAICTFGAPWSGLELEQCGWWVDHGHEPLAKAMSDAMAMSDEARQMMGARGRDWMARDFGWAGIAEKMSAVYSWCQGRGDRPDCVVE